MAVSLVPFNSLTAAPMNSAGANLPHVARLTGATSGEDSTAAKARAQCPTSRTPLRGSAPLGLCTWCLARWGPPTTVCLTFRGNPAQTRRRPGWGCSQTGLRCAGAELACRSVYEGLAASFWAEVVPVRKFGISAAAGTRRKCHRPRADSRTVMAARTKVAMEAKRAIWPICHQP